MICRHCNQEIPDGSAFCPHCGINTSEGELHPNPVTSGVGTDKQKADTCLQQIISLIVGVVFVFVCGAISKWLSNHMIGITGSLAVWTLESFLNTASVVLAVIGIAFAVIANKQDEQKRIQSNQIASIVFPVLQAVIILILLFGHRLIAVLYIDPSGNVDYTFDWVVSTFRTAALPMLGCAVVAILLGKLVKKKSLLLIVLIDFITLIISVAVTVFYAQASHRGTVPVAAGVGMGIMQPMAILLPSIIWSRGQQTRKQPVQTNAGQYASQTKSFEMFCPQCGKRFPTGESYCDQCGTMLKHISQPESFTTAPVSTNTQDAPSGGFAVLSFFFPIVGLILYLVWHDTLPLRAKSAGKGALAGVITSVGLSILAALLQLAAFSQLF